MIMPGIDGERYVRFKAKAANLTVPVLRASTREDAARLIIRKIKALKVRRVVSAPLTLVDVRELENHAAASGVDFCRQLNKQRIEQADLGISEFEMGIADLGALFQDASSLHTRLVSMLPPVHLALLPTASLVESFTRALEIIEETYGGQIPPYLSFITGPSKTADIERELTIGVHGPEQLIILCIDAGA
jgi:L-lactate dehydrogenase complex protein LldG